MSEKKNPGLTKRIEDSIMSYNRRIAGSPDRRIAGSPSGGRSRPLASPPDPSCSVSAARRPRRGFLALLLSLSLPLLAVLAPDAAAQNPTLSIAPPTPAADTEGTTPGTGTYFFSIELSAARAVATVVTACYSGGTATRDTTTATRSAGEDYSAYIRGALVGDECHDMTILAHQTSISSANSAGIAVYPDTLPESDETVIATLSTSDSGVTLGTSTATFTIQNDDGAVLSIAPPTPAAADEGDGSTNTRIFPVTLIGTKNTTTHFNVCFSGGTATRDTTHATVSEGEDYAVYFDAPTSSECVSASFATPGAAQNIGIRVYGDTLSELDETVIATLMTADSGVTLGTSTATFTIQDDDAPPTIVSFESATATVSEGGGSVRLPVTLSASRGTATVVPFISVGLSAIPEADYTSGPYSITIPAGDTRAMLDIAILEDANEEGNELFNVNIVSGNLPAGVALGSVGQVEVTIVDNDPTPCSNCAWITGGAAVTEGGNAVFTVNVNPMTTADVTVPLWVSDSPYGRGRADHVLGRHEGFEQVTIPSGAAGAIHTVPTKDDDRDEPHGSVRVEISGTPTAPGGDYYEIPGVGFFPYYLARGPQSADVTVWDNDAPLFSAHTPPEIYASVSDSAVTASATVAALAPAQICFGIVGGTYPALHPRRFPVKYKLSAGGRDFYEHLVWLDRETPQRCVAVRNNTACNAGTYTFSVLAGGRSPYRGQSVVDYTVSAASGSAEITVTPQQAQCDAERAAARRAEQAEPPPLPRQAPTLTLSSALTSVAEGGEVTFTIAAEPAPERDLDVRLFADQSMGGDGDYVADARFETLVLPLGTSSATWTFAAYSDGVARADGSIEARIEIDPDGSYALGAPSSVRIALLDDDGGTADGATDGTGGTGGTGGGTGGTGGGTGGGVGGTDSATDGAPEPTSVAPQSEPPGVAPALIAEVKAHVADFTARNHAAGIRDWTAILNRLEGRDGGMGDGDIAAWLARSQQHGWEDGIVTLPKVQAALAALAAVTQLTDPAVDPALVADVRAMAAQTHHGAAHVNRWRRVLMAFGEGSWPGLTPMTAAEAEENARRHSSPLWPRIAEILTARESTSAVESAPPGGVSAQLLADVADRAGETHLGAEHVERWLRALHTLEGVANDATIMLPAEARALVPLDPGRWGPVAEAIERLEARAFADALGN